MGKVIAISNQKGGVGKTTTAINLSSCLAELGKKVLVIDIDSQGNTTSGLGIDKENLDLTVYDIIVNYANVWETMTQSTVENLMVIPSESGLVGAEIELIGVKEKEYILKKEVDRIKDQYDYVLIDCPPSLSTLTVNAMTTADSILVPIQCEYYALEGLSELLRTIELVKDRLNPNLTIEGILFTMYDGRTSLSMQVVENVKENLDYRIYNTIIPRNVRLAEAPSYGMPINMYDPKSTGSIAYKNLAKEIIGAN